VAHELAHYQQAYLGGGTLLGESINEGVADFVGELISGQIVNPTLRAYGDAHEVEIWQEFSATMIGTELSRWLHNGGSVTATTTRPADLGYYVGYQITKAYYDRQVDKRKALFDIFHINSFADFLKASGYPETSSPMPPGRLVDIGGYRMHLNSSGLVRRRLYSQPGQVITRWIGRSFSHAWQRSPESARTIARAKRGVSPVPSHARCGRRRSNLTSFWPTPMSALRSFWSAIDWRANDASLCRTLSRERWRNRARRRHERGRGVEHPRQAHSTPPACQAAGDS
jgi:hypothetical protein